MGVQSASDPATPSQVRLAGRGSRRFRCCSLAQGHRFICLLVLATLCLYLPVEAFDSDKDVGFDDAILQSCLSVSPSKSTGPVRLPIPAGPPSRRLPSLLTLAVPGSLSPALAAPKHCQVQYLLAARLCARSRIAVTTPPTQELIVPRAAALLTDSPAVGKAVFYGNTVFRNRSKAEEGEQGHTSSRVCGGKED